MQPQQPPSTHTATAPQPHRPPGWSRARSPGRPCTLCLWSPRAKTSGLHQKPLQGSGGSCPERSMGAQPRAHPATALLLWKPASPRRAGQGAGHLDFQTRGTLEGTHRYFHSHPQQQSPLHSPGARSRWWAGPAGRRDGGPSGDASSAHSLWLLQEAVRAGYLSSLSAATGTGPADRGKPARLRTFAYPPGWQRWDRAGLAHAPGEAEASETRSKQKATIIGM